MPLRVPDRQLLPVAGGTTSGHTPTSGTTYTFANQPGINPGTGDTIWAFVMPRPGRVTRAQGILAVLGTLGSSQSITLRARNQTGATTQDITTTLQASSIVNTWSNTGLSLTFAAGDGLSIQFVCPTWTTTPTATFWTGMLEVEFSG